MSDYNYDDMSRWDIPKNNTTNPITGPRLPHYSTMQAALAHLNPNDAVNVIFPNVLRAQAYEFVTKFPGDVLYAVKANPHDFVLKTLWQSGVTSYDVASLREVQQVAHTLPDATLYMMHPIKSRQTIRGSYALGVRHFAFDDASELQKIMEETDFADDLTLHLRLNLPSTDAVYALEGKFGVPVDKVGVLLRAARRVTDKIGITFHVGSQCMDPVAYRDALKLVRDLLDAENIALSSLDVGGGFPVTYPGMAAPDLTSYFEAIRNALQEFGFEHLPILGEPGRAMVAEAGATLARVELRRGDELYLNDGTYGSLFDAGTPKWRFPVALMTGDGREHSTNLMNYSFWGPTCDSMDHMEGPFLLPDDIREGDWVEIGNLGAYGQTMATNFNGFQSTHTVTVEEEPIIRRGPIGTVIA